MAFVWIPNALSATVRVGFVKITRIALGELSAVAKILTLACFRAVQKSNAYQLFIIV